MLMRVLAAPCVLSSSLRAFVICFPRRSALVRCCCSVLLYLSPSSLSFSSSRLQGRYSVGVLFYLLAREVQRLRGVIDRSAPWSVPVDLFFYRDPEELKALEDSEKAAATAAGAGAEGAAAAGFEAVDAAAGFVAGEEAAAPEYAAGFEGAAPVAAPGWDGAAGGEAAAGGWTGEAAPESWGAAATY